MRINYMNKVGCLALTVLLGACGGGGSSSGGSSADTDVTRCIRAESVATNIDVFTSKARYTNTCDFAVSLAYRTVTITVAGPVTVIPGGMHEDLLGRIGAGEFIACRPPSQGTNKGDLPNPELGCT